MIMVAVCVVGSADTAKCADCVRDPLRKSSALLRNLTYFLDDSILRVRGRLKHSNLSFDRKHPVILPQRHFLTELVIQNSH